MDPRHERAIRQAAGLAFQLASIERSLEVAEEFGDFRWLPERIRESLASTEEIDLEDLDRCRRLIRGQ